MSNSETKYYTHPYLTSNGMIGYNFTHIPVRNQSVGQF